MFITTPIDIILGPAGSGKDTVAGFMVKNHGAIAIAQADPMKQLGAAIFGFTEDQLWGPSSSRNAPDERFASVSAWSQAEDRMWSSVPFAWSRKIFEKIEVDDEVDALRQWFLDLRRATWSEMKTLTPRIMLQTLGTEWGRHQSRNLWSNYAIKTATQLLGGGFKYDRTKGVVEAKDYAGPNRVVITDGRFRNEIVAIRMLGGAAIRIDSPNTDGTAIEKAGVKGHASEAEMKSIPAHFFTHFLLNDKSLGLDHLEGGVKALVDELENAWCAVDHPLDFKP
jgi:hypothetical protein